MPAYSSEESGSLDQSSAASEEEGKDKPVGGNERGDADKLQEALYQYKKRKMGERVGEKEIKFEVYDDANPNSLKNVLMKVPLVKKSVFKEAKEFE